MKNTNECVFPYKRSIGYATLGYEAKCEGIPPEKAGMLFDHSNFMPPLRLDINQAKKEIVIVSPFVLKSRVNSMIRLLLPLVDKNIKITVITRPAAEYENKKQSEILQLIAAMEHSGIKVVSKEGIHQKFIIMDHRIVWYGSLNLLSYGKNSEETMMRFENRDIAQELLGSWD